MTNQLPSIIQKAAEIISIDSEFYRTNEDPESQLKKLIYTILQVLNVASRIVYEGQSKSPALNNDRDAQNQKTEILDQGRRLFEEQVPSLLKLCFEFLKFSKDDLH